MAPLLNELFSKIELFYIKIGAINNYITLNYNNYRIFKISINLFKLNYFTFILKILKIFHKQ